MTRSLTRSFLTVVALMSVAMVCHAQPLPPVTHQVREATLNGQAQLVGRLPASQTMRLVLVLPLRNQSQLNELLKQLYDHSSPSYRKFLTVEEFTAQFGPTAQDYNTMVRWAEANGFTVAGTSRNRVNLDITGSVASIESALHVRMGVYRHPTENRTFYAPDREPTPGLPFQLWHIAGLDNYSIPRPAGLLKRSTAKPNATVGSGPSASFLGSDMRAAYYGGTTLTGAGQSIGLFEFVGTDLADLDTYFQNVDQTENVPITLVSTDGTPASCTYPDCDDTEQTLDMTQALGMAPGLSSLVVYVGSTDPAIFNAMATASPLNAQLSCSWAWTPADPSTDDPYFQEFAAQGQNLFAAAGDSGRWTASTEFVFPADDPYLTSVGGTDLQTSSAGGPWSSESAWVDGGGGISPDRFAIPFWQTTAASGCADCSTSYRNGPDVSANANFTYYVCADQQPCTANLYGGTSFAAPLWAGYLALVNQQAVAQGKSTLGFINPPLYDIGLGPSYDADLHDITSGSNGYPATPGYDLATGWGSPNGGALISALIGASATRGFGLTVSPTSLTIVQGSSASAAVTSAVTNGFDSAIALSLTGPPTGVTASFSPNPITGAGTTAMTIKVAPSTPEGTYRIKVKGTSGGTSEIAAIALTVAPTYFTLSASPSSISVARGGTGTFTMTTVAASGFDSPISLAATGYPTGVSIGFKPQTIRAPGSGTSTMRVTVGSGVALGNHTITINATGGGVTHTTQVTLDVLN